MQKLFNKILVPVDFSHRSKRAVEKAVQLASEYRCSVTLLHVITRKPHTRNFFLQGNEAVAGTKEKKARLWETANTACNTAGISSDIIRTAVLEGFWEECMVRYIQYHQIDLVIMTQKRLLPPAHAKFDADSIASKTHVPVITIPPGRKITRLNTIVIPVSDFLPVRKIMYGIYMASASNATLQLLQVKKEQQADSSEHYLYKAYKLIQDNCSIHACVQAARGENAATAIYEYMQQQNADLVIVNPDIPAKGRGLFHHLLGMLMQQRATAPVMTISPL